MIVVDTNVVVYMTFETEYSKDVAALHEIDREWAAPFLWRSEFLNVLKLYIKKKIVDLNETFEAIDYAHSLVANREHHIPPQLIVEHLFNSAASSYDCEFVALAQLLNVKLITFDSQLLKEFPGTAFLPLDYIKTFK